MTTDDFHKARRMFAVLGQNVIIAPPAWNYTHHQWLSQMFGDFGATNIITNHVRGFVWETDLHVYKGTAFNHNVMNDQVMHFLRVWNEPIKVIHFGAVEHPDKLPWPSIAQMDIEDFYTQEMTGPEKMKYIRDKTGIQFLKVKNALIEVKWDIKKALKALRDEVYERMPKI